MNQLRHRVQAGGGADRKIKAYDTIMSGLVGVRRSVSRVPHWPIRTWVTPLTLPLLLLWCAGVEAQGAPWVAQCECMYPRPLLTPCSRTPSRTSAADAGRVAEHHCSRGSTTTCAEG